MIKGLWPSMLSVDIEALGVFKPEVGISAFEFSEPLYEILQTTKDCNFDRKRLNNFVMAFCP